MRVTEKAFSFNLLVVFGSVLTNITYESTLIQTSTTATFHDTLVSRRTNDITITTPGTATRDEPFSSTITYFNQTNEETERKYSSFGKETIDAMTANNTAIPHTPTSTVETKESSIENNIQSTAKPSIADEMTITSKTIDTISTAFFTSINKADVTMTLTDATATTDAATTTIIPSTTESDVTTTVTDASTTTIITSTTETDVITMTTYAAPTTTSIDVATTTSISSNLEAEVITATTDAATTAIISSTSEA